MEYKFKTVYQGHLIDCIPDHARNKILGYHKNRKGNLVLLSIGCILESESGNTLPLFQYTGKKDKNDEEIYLGSKGFLFYDDVFEKCEFEIIWSKQDSKYLVKFTDIKENISWFDDLTNNIANKFKITGHSALDNKKN